MASDTLEPALQPGSWTRRHLLGLEELSPEEITRLLTFRLAHTLYCPGPWAAANVADIGREVVDTGANTLADTAALAARVTLRSDHVPEGGFAIVSLHRYENIFRRERFESLVAALEEMAETGEMKIETRVKEIRVNEGLPEG